jgi:hypothetical protein
MGFRPFRAVGLIVVFTVGFAHGYWDFALSGLWD